MHFCGDPRGRKKFWSEETFLVVLSKLYYASFFWHKVDVSLKLLLEEAYAACMYVKSDGYSAGLLNYFTTLLWQKWHDVWSKTEKQRHDTCIPRLHLQVGKICNPEALNSCTISNDTEFGRPSKIWPSRNLKSCKAWTSSRTPNRTIWSSPLLKVTATVHEQLQILTNNYSFLIKILWSFKYSQNLSTDNAQALFVFEDTKMLNLSKAQKIMLGCPVQWPVKG